MTIENIKKGIKHKATEANGKPEKKNKAKRTSC